MTTQGIGPPALLEPFDTPEPGPELRERAVGAALRVLSRPITADVWSLIWRSRPLRVAWACSVAALLFANLAVWRHHGAVAPPTARSQEQPLLPLDRELSAIVDLPRIDPNARGLSAPGENARPADQLLQPVVPSAPERKDSQS